MNRSELRKIIKEEVKIVMNEASREGATVEDFKQIRALAIELFPKWVITADRDRDFQLSEKWGRNNIHIVYRPDYNEIELFGLIKKEISSVSLADPRARYQTTSARRVRHKTKRLRKGFPTLDKAEKALRKFAENL
jgi:hypothetical protein